MENRAQIDFAFTEDERWRVFQDEQYLGENVGDLSRRKLQGSSPNNLTVLDDGSQFHPHIYSHGSLGPVGDEPPGSGPYLPLWQRRYVCTENVHEDNAGIFLLFF